MSVAPPGGNGTMKRTGFCGQDCAAAPCEREQRGRAASATSLSHDPPLEAFYSASAKASPRRARRRRGRGERLLPVAPGQEFEREHAQPAAEVRGEQRPRAPTRRLHQRLLGPGEERVQLAAPLPSAQKCSGRNSASAMPETRCTMRDPVGRVFFTRTPPSTARMPSPGKERREAGAAQDRASAPRQPSHSPQTARRPIGACTRHREHEHASRRRARRRCRACGRGSRRRSARRAPRR